MTVFGMMPPTQRRMTATVITNGAASQFVYPSPLPTMCAAVPSPELLACHRHVSRGGGGGVQSPAGSRLTQPGTWFPVLRLPDSKEIWGATVNGNGEIASCLQPEVPVKHFKDSSDVHICNYVVCC